MRLIAEFPAAERDLCREMNALAMQIVRCRREWETLDAARHICGVYRDGVAVEALTARCAAITAHMAALAARHDELERRADRLTETRELGA